MHVIQIVDTLERGGAERYVVELARELQRSRNVSCTVLSSGGALDAVDLKTVHPESGRRTRRWGDALRPLLGSDSVAHFHSLRSYLGCRRVTRAAGVPSVFTLHGWSPDTIGKKMWLLRLLSPDLVVAVSDELHAEAQRAGLRSVLIHSGMVDRNADQRLGCDNPSVDRVPGRFLTAGRLVEVKRFDLLIDALSTLPEGVSLDILGDGPLRESLIRHAATRGVSDRVSFPGFVEPDSWMLSADWYVCSSRSEGLSLAQIEALMFGLPIVSTPVSGAHSLTDGGKGGVLADGYSSREIADAMLRAIGTPPHELLALRQAARQRFMTRFDITRHVEPLCEVYHGIAEMRSP